MRVPPISIDGPEGGVVVNLDVYEENGAMVCGIHAMAGKIKAPPKRWVRVVREELARIEALVRNAGCVEIRLCGRDWGRVLPDYEHYDGVPNGLRKRLV